MDKAKFEVDFDHELDRLINNLKKFNESIKSINDLLRGEKDDERTDSIKQDSDRTESTEESL